MAWKSVLVCELLLSLGGLGAAPAIAQATAPSAPRLESKLREVIADLQAGTPKLDQMEPGLSDAVKQQQAAMGPIFAQLGPLASVTYDGLKNGMESYKVVFEHGSTMWVIDLAPSGKIATLAFANAQ